MMANLVSEGSSIQMLSGKRLHEYDNFGARFLRGFKRPRIFASRNFPPNCGAAASMVRNEGGTHVKTSNEWLKIEESKPLVEVSRTKLNSNELMKPLVKILSNDLKSKSTKQQVKLLHGKTALQNGGMGLLSVSEEVKLINVLKNNVIPKHIDMICGSDTSPTPCITTKKYPPLKSRKGITIVRDFPRDCGSRNSLPLKHVTTKSNFLDMEVGNALRGQHNGALSVKQSDDLKINNHHEALSHTKEVLDLFEQILKERLLKIQLEKRSMGKTNMSCIYTEVAMVLKDQKKWIYMNQKILGSLPGVKVGDQFRYRAELVVVGLHARFISGINYMEKDGKKIATSVVCSGRYSSDKEFTDVLIYSGQGGNRIMGGQNIKDQALVRGNLALKNSMDEKNPVRVILGRRSSKIKTFTYYGLYIVSHFWKERARNGKLVYMFQLNRMKGQAELKISTLQNFGKSKACHRCALINDISSGEEQIPICVVNDFDSDKPPTFNYMKKMVYPQLHMETSGFHCIDG